MREKIELGYFCHTKIGYGETFIYDLLKSLNKETSIDVTYYYGGVGRINHSDEFKYVSTGYSEKFEKTLGWLIKIVSPIIRNSSILYYKLRKRISIILLSRKVKTNIDVAYVDYATSAVLLKDYFEKKGIPYIVHVHGYDVTSSLNTPGYTHDLLTVFDKAKYIITPSMHIGRLIKTLGCPPEKVKPIYPLTNIENIEEPSWQSRKNSLPEVTFLGRFTHKKNPIALIYAFSLVAREIPEIRFNLLGDGPLMPDVRTLVSKLNLEDKINITGVVNREIGFKYLQQSWVYAQHSVTSLLGDQEGFPVSLAEAAAHALPLVSTIHSGITENIINGETGFLVQEYDYETMAEKIIYLIENPDIAEQMGKAGRKHILNICTPGKRVQNIKDLLFEVSTEK